MPYATVSAAHPADGDAHGRIGLLDCAVKNAVRAHILLRSGVVLPRDIRLVADQPKRTWVRGRSAFDLRQIGRELVAVETDHAQVGDLGPLDGMRYMGPIEVPARRRSPLIEAIDSLETRLHTYSRPIRGRHRSGHRSGGSSRRDGDGGWRTRQNRDRRRGHQGDRDARSLH
jgi:hypothetical protein